MRSGPHGKDPTKPTILMAKADMSGIGRFSTKYRFLVLILVPVVVLGLVVSCQDRRTPRPRDQSTTMPQTQELIRETPSPTQVEPLTPVNRIAYVGTDGNLFTIKPDGSDSRRLTSTDLRVGPRGGILAQGIDSQVIYTWPTWSPDSKKLATSRAILSQENITFSVEVVDASTGTTTRVYDNEPGSLGIAERTPHYLYWSPDSNHLAFLASTLDGLALFINTPGNGKEANRLLEEGPLYFHWADDSSRILVHHKLEMVVSSVSRGVFQTTERAGPVSLGFRVPSLSRDASEAIYIITADSRSRVFRADTQPLLAESRPILEVGPAAAIIRSPTRDEVAVADVIDGPGSVFDRLTLVPEGGGSGRPLVIESFLAFFWSPNGEKIVYVALDLERRSLVWKYVDRTEGEPVDLAEFQPSTELLTVISFFDQYAHSSSLWSPDSSQIVFSGLAGADAETEVGDPLIQDRVYVLDVRDGARPREIAVSRFAVWSWR